MVFLYISVYCLSPLEKMLYMTKEAAKHLASSGRHSLLYSQDCLAPGFFRIGIPSPSSATLMTSSSTFPQLCLERLHISGQGFIS